MSNFSIGFNPVHFIYLNPKLCVDNNIYTVEDVYSWLNLNSNATFLSNMDVIPSMFDSETYLNSHKDVVDFSTTNSNIGYLMSRDYSYNELLRRGTYFPNINKSIISKGSNVFSFQVPGESSNVIINSSNLSQGDVVGLLYESIFLCSTVTNIINTSEFQLDSNIIIPKDVQIQLYGIKLYDINRLAHIAYLTMYNPSVPPFAAIDSNFNPQLYRLLYPSTANLTNDDAYTDYLSYNGTRIGSVNEIGIGGGGGGEMGNNVSILTVSEQLNLTFNEYTGKFTWNGTDMYYVTADHQRALKNLSPFINGLITEYAIKKWTYDLFWPQAVLNNASFSNVNTPVISSSSSNILVQNYTVFSSNTSFKKDSMFESNANVVNTLSSGRIAIGPVSPDDPPIIKGVVESNIHLKNSTIDETLYVGKNAQVDGNFYGSNVFIQGSASCGKYGIGPVVFQTYNNDWMDAEYYQLGSNSVKQVSIPGSVAIPGSLDVSGSLDITGDTVINGKTTVNGEFNITGGISASNLNVGSLSTLKDINTFANVLSQDLIIKEDSNMLDMLYDTSLKLGIDYSPSLITRDMTASLIEPVLCETNLIDRINIAAPLSANFVITSNEEPLRILENNFTSVRVQTSSLPNQLVISKFKVKNENAMSVGLILQELVKQVHTLATNYH